ncbi:MAG: hypothetical protein QXD04_04715 [Candidatus Bathyarchaeia archaeon]
MWSGLGIDHALSHEGFRLYYVRHTLGVRMNTVINWIRRFNVEDT